MTLGTITYTVDERQVAEFGDDIDVYKSADALAGLLRDTLMLALPGWKIIVNVAPFLALVSLYVDPTDPDADADLICEAVAWHASQVWQDGSQWVIENRAEVQS